MSPARGAAGSLWSDMSLCVDSIGGLMRNVFDVGFGDVMMR